MESLAELITCSSILSSEIKLELIPRESLYVSCALLVEKTNKETNK